MVEDIVASPYALIEYGLFVYLAAWATWRYGGFDAQCHVYYLLPSINQCESGTSIWSQGYESFTIASEADQFELRYFFVLICFGYHPQSFCVAVEADKSMDTIEVRMSCQRLLQNTSRYRCS